MICVTLLSNATYQQRTLPEPTHAPVKQKTTSSSISAHNQIQRGRRSEARDGTSMPVQDVQRLRRQWRGSPVSQSRHALRHAVAEPGDAHSAIGRARHQKHAACMMPGPNRQHGCHHILMHRKQLHRRQACFVSSGIEQPRDDRAISAAFRQHNTDRPALDQKHCGTPSRTRPFQKGAGGQTKDMTRTG